MDKEDIIKFKEYLQEREMIEKEMNMQRLFEEFKEDMRRKKLWNKNKWQQMVVEY